MNNLRRYTLYIENITDIAALILSFAAAYLLRFYVFQSETYSPQAYLQLLLAMIVAYIIIDITYLGRSDFLGRNAAGELRETFITVSFTTLALLVYVFFTKTNDLYSRIFIFTFALIAYILMYLLRTFVRRKILPLYSTGKGAEKVVVIGSRSDVGRILRRFARHPDCGALAERVRRLAASGAQVIAVGMNTPKCLAGLPENVWQIGAWQYDTLAVQAVKGKLSHK